MKFNALLGGLIAVTSLNANAAIMDYTSTFTDNGNKVTEVRTFTDNSVQTWEWLDLTVTNGISYNSLVADLNNDGLLNNSDSVLYANNGALLDVQALVAEDRTGWNTVSDNAVVDLFNAYFGTALVDDIWYPFIENSALVDDFIVAFGDTYYEGRDDVDVKVGVNGSGNNSGLSFGITNTAWDKIDGFNEATVLTDGQWHNDSADLNWDTLDLDTGYQLTGPSINIGTWLNREVVTDVPKPVVDVPEPSSIALFALALSGLAARRRRLV